MGKIMVKGEDFFNSLDYLDPKCPKCEIKIDWGESTEWCEEKQTQICKNCKTELK